MKTVVLCLTVLGWVGASPNGYYHQEYNYKTSSSAYKNNELQHQTDDQGYYRKHGDLEGRTRPKVDANSEHSEYINPNLKTTGDYRTGFIGSANGDMSSTGHMRADIGSYGATNLASEGLAHGDNIASSSFSGYNSGYNSNSYGSSSSSYGTTSNLRSVTSQLQRELENELQRALQENRAYSSVSVAELERELRQNLTNRLNAELSNRYGQQSIRGGLSYTISGGRLHSTANYDNQELQDLKSQLENNLLNRLRTQYYQSSSSSSSSHYERQNHGGYGVVTTLRPTYHTIYPNLHSVTTIRPTYSAPYNTRDDYTRYTPIPNPESITTIATRIQNQLDTRLNELLEEAQRRYFSSNTAYSLTNTDVVLENLRNELRNNITYLLNEQVRVNYGTQVPRDGHMYSVGPNGQTSNQYNYAISDLENLRSQIERNLIEKLNRDFERYRSRWYQQSSASSTYQSSNSNVNGVKYGGYSTPRYVYTTPRYETYNTPQYNTYDSDVEHFSTRPSSSHIAPLITSGSSSSGNRQYNLIAGSHQAGYEVSGASGSSISQLQRRLQQDLSRQLQAAISRGHYGSYRSSDSYNPQSYQTSLQQLTDELNRNLTRQLQEYSASGYYSAHGNFDQAEMSRIRSQLQSDLMRQLQQGLQQSYHSSSSYSASSSSSSNSGDASYRPIRGFNSNQVGQYRSGGHYQTLQGEDCVGDDPNAYTNRRMKRSYQPYRSQPLGIGYNAGYSGGYSGSYRHTGNYGNYQPQPTQQQPLGQQVDDSDLTQQVEDVDYGRLQNGFDQQQGQQVDDLAQQVQDSGFGKLQLGSQGSQQVQLGQQVDNSDSTQQVENYDLGRLQLGSQNLQQVQLGQQVDESDLTQQVEDSGFGKLQLGSQGQQQVHYGQQVDNSDLTQQVEDSGLGKWQLGSQSQQQVLSGQQVDDSDLTQQVEDSGLGKLQLGPQNQQQLQLGQQVDESDLTQQIEDSGLGKLKLGSQSQQRIISGQQVDDLDSTHQVEDFGFGKLQLGSQSQQQVLSGQQVDDSDLTQQVEDSGLGKLQLGSQSQQQVLSGQQVDDADLTQQVEDSGFGKLQSGSQSQQQVLSGQQVDDSDVTQQVEDGLGRLQLNSENSQQQVENSDITQQLEGSSSGRLQLGFQGQQQNNIGQEVDDFDTTQQVEPLGPHKLKLGSQTHSNIGQYENTDLQNQQQNSNRRYYNPHYGQSNPDVTQHSLTSEIQFGSLQKQGDLNSQQRQNRIEFSQPQENSDLTQQTDNSFLLGSQSGGSHSQINLNLQQRPQRIQFGQQEDDSDLTQQVDSSFLPGNQLGSGQIQSNTNYQPNPSRLQFSQREDNSDSTLTQNQIEPDLRQNPQSQRGDQKSEDFDRFTTQQHSSSTPLEQIHQNRPIYDINFGSHFDKEQKRLAYQLEKELSNKLKDAVRNYYTTSYSTSQSFQTTYQDLLRELERNLTKQLQAPSNNKYSYYYIFNGQQRELLRNELENILKLQLHTEITHTTGNKNVIDQESNSALDVQQQQNGLELTGQSLTSDEHLEENILQQAQTTQIPDNLIIESNAGGRLQPSQTVQQSIDDSNTNPPGSYQRPVTTNQVNFYRPSQYPYRYPSGNLQLQNRPINRKPVDSNSFLQSEIAQQQNNYPSRDFINQQTRPGNGPNDLNKIQQQQSTPNIENINASQQSHLELDNPENDLQQQVDSDFTNNQQQNIVSAENPNETPTLALPSSSTNNLDSQQDINRQNDFLINTLRNKITQTSSGDQLSTTDRPRSYSQVVSQGNSDLSDHRDDINSQYLHRTNSYNNGHSSFQIYLNNEQTQLAQQLEDSLSKQLKDAVSQNTYTVSYTSGTLSPELYQTNYETLLKELQRNITKELENTFNGVGGYSSYSTYSYGRITSNQRQKLLNELQAHLSRQLQQQLEISYSLQSTPVNTPSSNAQGYNSYGTNLNQHGTPIHHANYGQQEIIPGSQSVSKLRPSGDTIQQLNYAQHEIIPNVETASELNPYEPQQATLVENVKPQVSANVGVKGHGRYRPRVSTPVSQVEEIQPINTAVQPQPPPLVKVESVTPELTEVETISEENLPWWKRFGNKVKQGATNLKEKIIG